jgi:hypothetical protein
MNRGNHQTEDLDISIVGSQTKMICTTAGKIAE